MGQFPAGGMVCLITSKVLLVVKGGYVGSVGLPSAVG